MKLAINYSPQTADLLTQGRVAFDLYKTTEWPEMIAEAEKQRPAYVHFPLMAGRHNMDAVGIPRIRELMATTATPFVNTHLAPRAKDFDMAFESMDRRYLPALIESMMRDVAQMVALFGKEGVILENGNYDPNYDLPTLVILPEVITQVVMESGCGLLLDLAHAHMAATYLKIETREYISRMPVSMLRELHVAGTRYVPEQQRLVDHYPMTEDDWAITAWALEQIHSGTWPEPNIVGFEYGGTGGFFGANSDIQVLARDIPRLRELVLGLHMPTSS